MINTFLTELASAGINAPLIPNQAAPHLHRIAPLEYSTRNDLHHATGRWAYFYHQISDSNDDSMSLYVTKAGRKLQYHYHLIYGPLWIFLDTSNLSVFNHCLEKIKQIAQSFPIKKWNRNPLTAILSTSENSFVFISNKAKAPDSIYYQSPEEVIDSIPTCLSSSSGTIHPLSGKPFWMKSPLQPSDFIFLQGQESVPASDIIPLITEPQNRTVLADVLLKTVLEKQLRNPLPLGNRWSVVVLYPKNFRMALGRYLWFEWHDTWYSARSFLKKDLVDKISLALAVFAFLGQPENMRITIPLHHSGMPIGLAWSHKKPKQRSGHSVHSPLPVLESFEDYFKEKTRPHLFIK